VSLAETFKSVTSGCSAAVNRPAPIHRAAASSSTARKTIPTHGLGPELVVADVYRTAGLVDPTEFAVDAGWANEGDTGALGNGATATPAAEGAAAPVSPGMLSGADPTPGELPAYGPAAELKPEEEPVSLGDEAKDDAVVSTGGPTSSDLESG
jgi:hypothetical protein